MIVKRARLSRQVFPAQDKYAIVAGACLRPDERKLRKRPFQPAAIVADLHHEESSRPQKVPCRKQDPACEIQTVPPAVDREPRLVTIFRRQTPHRPCRDIGWIGDYEVVS